MGPNGCEGAAQRNSKRWVVHMIDDALAELDSNDSNVKVLLRNY